eukprot:jgi/Chlat1/120/Chrsp1S03218
MTPAAEAGQAAAEALKAALLKASVSLSGAPSAAQLQACIDFLRQESEVIKERVHDTIADGYHQQLGVFNDAAHVQEEVGDSLTQLDELLTSESGADEDEELQRLALSERQITEQLRQNAEQLEALSLIVRLNTQLRNINVATGGIDETASALHEFAGALASALPAAATTDSSVDGNEHRHVPKALELLRDKYQDLLSEFRQRMGWHILSVFHIDKIQRTLTIKASQSGTDSIRTLLEAAARSNLLPELLRLVADDVMRTFVEPLATTATYMSQDSDVISFKLQLHDGVASQSPKMKLQGMFSSLLLLLEFLCRHAVADTKTGAEELGAALWLPLCDKVKAGHLSKALDSIARQAAAFDHAAAMASNFETSVEKLGIIKPASGARHLSQYVADAEVSTAVAQRQKVLLKARSLLLDTNHSTVRVSDCALSDGMSGTSSNDSASKQLSERTVLDAAPVNACTVSRPYFHFSPCQVSRATIQLCELATSTLEDACHARARSAAVLYRTARDVFDVFRAVAPIRARSTRHESVPQLPMLFHNDCIYLAHQALTLGPRFQKHMSKPLCTYATFIDFAPYLLRIGKQAFYRQLNTQGQELAKLIDALEGLGNTDDEVRYAQVEHAFKQTLHMMHKLKNVWQQVLYRGTLLEALAAMVETVASRLVTEILALQDMSVDEDEQLRKLLQLFMECSDLFAPEEESAGEAAGEMDHVSIGDLVPHWKQLKLLAEMLDMGLVAITEAWENGTVRACGFTAEQTSKLVRAIFSDTQLRRDCLRRISG